MKLENRTYNATTTFRRQCPKEFKDNTSDKYSIKLNNKIPYSGNVNNKLFNTILLQKIDKIEEKPFVILGNNQSTVNEFIKVRFKNNDNPVAVYYYERYK